jgi:hypothetical protein
MSLHRNLNLEATMESTMNDLGVPTHIRQGLIWYILYGIPPGGFLQAVIQNDLKMSFAKADHINQSRMFNIVNWMYNNAPHTCWGSSEACKEWIEHRGTLGTIEGDFEHERTDTHPDADS